MSNQIIIAKSNIDIHLNTKMINRHGLIAGATGTGKTVSLRVLAESFSQQGIPVFISDIKGDIASISQQGNTNEKLEARAKELLISPLTYKSFPVTYWDVFGEKGHPIRATISDLGPLLLSRILNLNEVQSSVLNLVFKIADDQGLLLLDVKDLQSLLHYVGENAKEYLTTYGNISAASIGAIQRSILQLTQQGAEKFFGEPALNIFDLIQTDQSGHGIINVLSAERLIETPLVYSTFLLWLLAELFEQLPECGDLDKPKLVFFFDEAHLLFSDTPKIVLDKIEQVVRLIRSKGVGVYFVTQSPLDISENVLKQLGNRIQHALRAFTPKEEKNIKAVADTFRSNDNIDINKALTELRIGEAIISLLQEDGSPGYAERALMYPPTSRLGTITDAERETLIKSSLVYGQYEKVVDRESAFELLKNQKSTASNKTPQAATQRNESSILETISNNKQVNAFATSAVRAIGTQIGRQIIRGILGSVFGGVGNRRR
ncbi:MAG: DUF853 family protein [Proteobacteria bacterium]|nr:DUF853 family protein [Pseudomonadota bacterium]